MPTTIPTKTEWITLADAAEQVGPRRAGRPTSKQTIWVWHHVGYGSTGIKLRAWFRGGILMTKPEELEDFFHRLDQHRSAEAKKAETSERSNAQSSRDADRARRLNEQEGAR
jgi:hypothetical protein